MAELIVKNLGKKHVKSIKTAMLHSLKDILSDAFFISRKANVKLRKDEFWAINDVSFEIKPGQCIGVIGPNGSGKSTLLKLLSGIYLPDRGSIEIEGTVAELIEVSAGFHPLLTGRENIYVNGSILGLNKKEIDKKINEIIKFAELEEFIDVPVKFYSSGMYVRLGFSIAAHVEPDILLVDEVLAVGDISFKRRCLARMKRYVKSGGTLIFVSHDVNIINNLCDECIVLDKGKVAYQGDNSGAIDAYYAASLKSISRLNNDALINNNDEVRYGTGECEITNVVCVNNNIEIDEENTLISASEVSVIVFIKINKWIGHIKVGFHVTDIDGVLLFNLSAQINENDYKSNIVKITFNFLNPLNDGKYRLGAGIRSPELDVFLDRRINYKTLNVISKDGKGGLGLINIPFKSKIEVITS